MPSQSEAAASDSLCIYGDSHVASVKLAWDQGLIDAQGRKVGFWGAAGPSFRGLRWKQGRIVADAGAQADLDLVRGDGPETLGAKDFGAYLFYGARLRLSEFLLELSAASYLSQAALEAATWEFMMSTRTYRFARNFAKAGAPVWFVPTSLPTQGVFPPKEEAAKVGIDLAPQEVDRAFAMLRKLAAKDRVTMVIQPPETLTDEFLTRREFAVENADAARDVVHKSPEFAALMVAQVLDQMKNAKAA